jgi:uncharacterized protein (TIGR00730 family)
MSVPRSICIFCGSSERAAAAHRREARRFGGILARAGIELVYGGGRVGMMGAAADGALAGGGRVVGVIPEHLMRREVGHTGCTELIVTPNMHERKATMFARADAFVVLPGGPGTLDETFEILTWRQLSLHDKPVVVCDMGGYWKPLVDLVRHMERSRYVQKSFLGFFSVVPRVDDVLEALRAAPAPRKPVRADRI